MTIASLADEQAHLRRQFRGLLIAITVAVLVGNGVDVYTLLTDPASMTYLDFVTNGSFLATLAVLWWLFWRNQIGAASLFGSVIVLLASILIVTTNTEPISWVYAILLILIALVISLPYITSRTFRWLAVGAFVVGLGILAYITVWQWQIAQSPIGLADKVLSVFVVFSSTLFLLWQFSNLHHMLVSSLRGGNAELLELKASLEQQVAERTAELQTTLTNLQAQNAVQQRLLGEIQSQQQLIQALSVPVLPLSTQVLVLPLIGSLDTSRLDLIRERALAAIEQSRARVLVLDVTGVPEVDTHIAQGLLHVARATRMMGSQCVLAGMRPELAQALVRLGVDLGSLRTYATLQRALDVVR